MPTTPAAWKGFRRSSPDARPMAEPRGRGCAKTSRVACPRQTRRSSPRLSMADPVPRLRLIPGGDARERRRRSPGPAVLLVLGYAVLFGGGLWVIRARTQNGRRPRAPEVAVPQAEPDSSSHSHSRPQLLAGDWI